MSGSYRGNLMWRSVRRARSALSAACGVVLLVVLPGPPASASLHSGSASVSSAASVSACPSTGYGVHYYAPGSGKTVALTFDDGPGRDTARIMHILQDSHVEATFFNLGMYEAQRPRTVSSEQHAGFAL